jgi:hypothetical protein
LPEDLALQKGARRENILYGSLTDEQRRCSAKYSQPSGLIPGEQLAALLLSHRTQGYASSSRLTSCPPELSALILYYEMGSKQFYEQSGAALRQ